MLTRRWLIVVPSVVAVAAIGLGAWQVVDARSQVSTTRQQLAALRTSDNHKLAVAQAKASKDQNLITAANRALNLLGNKYDAATAPTTTTTSTVPAQTSNGLEVSLTRGSDQVVTGTTFTVTATITRTSSPYDTVNGTVTFSNDGSVLSFCRNVTMQIQIPGAANIATCSMNFTVPGTYDLSAFATANDGQTGSSSLTITVSS